MYPLFDSTHWVTPFGLMFLFAIVIAWAMAHRNALSIGIDGSHVDLLVPVTVIVGLVGAVLLSRLMPFDRIVAGNMMQADVRVRLVGVLASGAVAMLIYSRIGRLSFRRLLDIFALPTIAGLMVHRVGCYLAGCCWGDLVAGGHVARFDAQVRTLPFLDGFSAGVQYPPGSLPYEQHMVMGLIMPGASSSLPIYPVQLYESAFLLALLLLLRRINWQQKPAGVLALMCGCCYALLRFLMEYLRADAHIVIGNLTITQLQCLLLLTSAVLLPRLMRQPVNEPAAAR
jgi:phosphatidylglycerol:prolipoprotein diacylglycerol transferase